MPADKRQILSTKDQAGLMLEQNPSNKAEVNIAPSQMRHGKPQVATILTQIRPNKPQIRPTPYPKQTKRG
jgi:hypothetical protein